MICCKPPVGKPVGGILGLRRLVFLPKVHFFKLAQELGERPVELQKKLASAGISVRSTSTMLDEDTAVKIRHFLQQETAVTQTETPAQPQAEAQIPVPPQAPTTSIPAPTEAPAPTSAPEISAPRPVTHVIKRIPGGDGQVVSLDTLLLFHPK
jgi:hypothetical protein